ncbi:DUF4436 domain-containing protein [Mycobacterium sp. pR1184]|uniref:DUF4436 domain-containing protein n=1 Tax=Mycobacterium sp. pR1184 TaxID=3238981 RepID=UPI00351B3B6D
MGQPRPLTEGEPAADGTTVVMDLKEVHAIDGELIANLTVSPGSGLLDPMSHDLSQDLTVVVTSATTPTKRTWSKGMLPGVFPVPLTLTGDVTSWPFDDYHSGTITVELFRGNAPVPQRASVTFVDRLRGWHVDVGGASKAGDLALYRVAVQRSPTTAAFAAAILGIDVLLASTGVFVVVQTARDRLPVQPGMTTWYGAMLFSVVMLRSTLPDAPPIGWWVDVAVVLWVIVVLAVSMVLYVYCWWRHARPAAKDPNQNNRRTHAAPLDLNTKVSASRPAGPRSRRSAGQAAARTTAFTVAGRSSSKSSIRTQRPSSNSRRQ